ncbi:MAG TPA: sugar transferase, partial [Candidatus Didemnitutus sp.]|nr:sugar transferase [Candidatus Didemnitutus sp.]
MIKGKQATLVLILLDTLCVSVTFNLVGYARGIVDLHQPILSALELPVLAFIAGIYLIDGYSQRTNMVSVTYTSLHALAVIGVTFFTLLLTFVFIPAGFPLQSSRIVIAVSYLVLIPVTLGYRRFFSFRLAAHRQQRYFLFLGSPENCRAFREECQQNRMTQSVLYATHETFLRRGDPAHSKSRDPGFGDIVEYLEEYTDRLDAIILRESSHDLPAAVAQRLVDLYFSGVPTYTLELFHEVYWRKIPLYRLNQTWLFQQGFQIAREPVFERLKRLSDIVLSCLGLLLFAPFFPFVALAIWLEDRGSVIFDQPRVGRNRVIFPMHKLRTMKENIPSGADYTQENDPRITTVGRFLRKSRIDEFPQLWNVLKGDMSLIGPRAEW